MPVAVSLLTAGAGGADGVSVSTDSVTPTAGADVFACVVAGLSGGTSVTPTCSGNGQVWTLIDQTPVGGASGNDVQLFVFHAKVASPTPGAITFSFGAESQQSWTWHVVECTGTAAASAVVQTAKTTAIANPVTNALAALANANNVHIAFSAERGTATGWIADADFASLAELIQSGYNQGSFSQWGTGEAVCELTAPVPANGVGVISIEVAVASEAGDGSGPEVTNLTPAPASELSPFTAIEFDVGDADGLGGVVITCLFEGEDDPILVYDGDGFRGRWAAASSYVANDEDLANPGHFSLLPEGGWRLAITELKIAAYDTFGSETFEANAWSLQAPAVVVSPIESASGGIGFRLRSTRGRLLS